MYQIPPSPLYIWGYNPILVGVFIFFFDFGAGLLLRVLFEKKFYWGDWWTFKIGDSIFLPVYFFAATSVMNGVTFPTHTIYDHVWWHVILTALGYINIFIMEMNLVRLKFYTAEYELFAASQIYHTIIYGILFYLIISVWPLLLTNLTNPYVWLTGAALVGFGIMAIIDHWRHSMSGR